MGQTEAELLARIRELNEARQQRRDAANRGEITRDQELADLAELAASVDQVWDLIRQRRALREFGKDEDTASQRSKDEVEGYWQ